MGVKYLAMHGAQSLDRDRRVNGIRLYSYCSAVRAWLRSFVIHHKISIREAITRHSLRSLRFSVQGLRKLLTNDHQYGKTRFQAAQPLASTRERFAKYGHLPEKCSFAGRLSSPLVTSVAYRALLPHGLPTSVHSIPASRVRAVVCRW